MLFANRSLWAVSLLVSMTLSGCASSTPIASDSAALGYDLSVDGSEVSLAFHRALTMPEFLQLAQEVTSARYVYRGDGLAAVGPVTLMGRIRCQRNEFPSFVGTMLHIHGLHAKVQGAGDGQYIEVAPAARS